MKTTVTIDQELLKDARELSGISGTDELVEAALRALMHRHASRQLAELGGTMPDFEYPRQRRYELDEE